MPSIKRKHSRFNRLSFKKKVVKSILANSKKKQILASEQQRSSRNTMMGLFIPKYPEKYIGDVNRIIYRSSWEFDYMKILDLDERVIQWSSEPFGIPYVKPTDNKVHKYYPDFYVVYKDKNGNLKKKIVEIKPDKETRPPSRVGKSKKQQLYEIVTWEINTAKWKAAKKLCEEQGLEFEILTEKRLYV